MIFVFFAIFLQIFVFFFLASFNIINDDIISGVFLSFQPCNGSMWLRGSDNKPIQKLKIFSVVFTNFDSCISECFNLNTRIVVNDRSSLQS